MSADTSPRALLIGGLDPTGGAGVLLDAFVAASLGLQPTVAVTIVTAQDSARWRSAMCVDGALLTEQLEAIGSEGPVACVKIGALGSAANVSAVAEFLRRVRPPAVVLDPALASSTGGTLTTSQAIDAMHDELFSLADIITPNADEACVLAPGTEEPTEAGSVLAAAHGCRVLITGLADVPGSAADLLIAPDGTASRYSHPYIVEIGDVRGTGCMLATALACRLTRAATFETAVVTAHVDLLGLLRHSRHVGRGLMQLDLGTLLGR